MRPSENACRRKRNGSSRRRVATIAIRGVATTMSVVMPTSAAAMFRMVEKEQPTLLMDECDTYLGPRVSKEHEDVRGLVTMANFYADSHGLAYVFY